MEYSKQQKVKMAQRRVELVESELSVVQAKIAVIQGELDRLGPILTEAELELENTEAESS